MTDTPTNEINLRPLFVKLGHNLEEIRVRALNNILSKLEHGLVCDSDLVQEKHLHIRLLEWFNFSSCPLQQQVLALILRFTKHASAAQIYVEIGGVEFIAQLRTNIDTSLHKLVDAILDNLFHLPTVNKQQHAAECFYQHKQPTTEASEGLPSHYLQASLTASSPDSEQTEPLHISQGKLPSPENQQLGYFGLPQEEPRTQTYVRESVPAATASCFKFCTFPWVPLTATDRHVLSSTDNSLKSKDVSLVVSACEFLSDVVFQDFPAEVFLQRPVIVKSLLSLLNLPSHEKHEACEHAVQTLRDLTTALEARIYYYQDPSLYTPKQEFTIAPSHSDSSSTSFLSHSLASSDSRPSVIGHSDTRQGGDGQDGNSSQNSSAQTLVPEQIGDLIEQTDIEDIQSLQFLQWTTPQYCMATLEKLLPCLKTPDERFVLHGLELIHQLTALLGESVSTEALWEDSSLPARELKEKFHDLLEMICDVMYLHHHGNLAATIPQAELAQHRVAYIGLAIFLVRFIETLVPSDKVNEALPELCAPVLNLLCQDESLAHSYPDVRTFVGDLLYTLDPENYNLSAHAQIIGQSMRNACAFLMDFKDMSDENILELLNAAEEGMKSLLYHQNLQFVEGSVQLASYIGKKSSPNPIAVQQCHKVLLALMAHPLAPVRLQTLTTILGIVKEALGVEHVIEPTSTLSQNITFMFERTVLYQLIVFGCCDSHQKVKQVAEEILLYFLQSQLLLPAVKWQQLLDALLGVLPVLQALGEPDSNLSTNIVSLFSVDPQIETGNLPILERFRGTLRLMFSQHPRLRMEGLGRLAWFLANEENSMRKLPLFSELDVTNLTNIFIIEPQRSLLDEDLDSSVFKTESLQKVYEIFISENVEATVRRSAGEQLSIIMQDPSLHSGFRQLSGLEMIISMMNSGVQKPETNTVNVYSTVIPCMIKMLRSLVQHDFSLRHKLAHNSSIYYLILRCGLLHYRDSALKKEVSELLAFLLFDEVAQVKTWKDKNEEMPATFSLPILIVKSFKLPFRCLTHHLMSPHMILVPPEPDPLTKGSLAEMLRIIWNIAWHQDIKSVIEAKNKTEDQLLFSKSLRLTTTDHTVLATSYMPYCLQQCIHDVDNATGHSVVARSTLRLSSYIVLGASQGVSEILHQIKWQDILERFILVVPSSNADEALLGELLQLLSLILKSPLGAPAPVLQWIVGLLQNPKGALLGLLGRAETNADDLPEPTLRIRRQLNRQLLKFVQTFVGKYPYSLVDKTTFNCVRGDLTLNLLTRINRRDTTHFYNLASLESTLLCLMHVTARPGWSVGSPDSNSLSLSLQTLQNLSEVISAFHVGRGGMSMSYMGRGVTRCATICLRHLAHEMATQLHSKDWPRNWLFSRQATADSVGESGLHWLIPLWSYRDTEVRSAGVGIAAALTSTEAGRITMATQCQHIAGGIWGTAFSLLLDQTECSMVRQQAALLLVNLTSQPMPSGSVETAATVWQGPIVRNEETQVSLVGLSALLALLHHSQFYQEMMVVLANYYPQPAIHPISVAGGSPQSSPLGSQATVTTAGSVTPAGTSHLSDTGGSAGQLMTSTPTDMRPDTEGRNPNNQYLAPPASGSHNRSADSNRLGSSAVGGTHNTSRNTTTDTHTSVSAGTNTPASIGDRSGTASSTDVSDRAEYHSVVAPCLVSSITHLLANLIALAPEDTLLCMNRENMHGTLLSLLDVGLIEAYKTELFNTKYKKQFLITFQDLLSLHCDILKLLCRCCTKDDSTRQDVLKNTSALKQVIRLLGVAYQGDADTESICTDLWWCVFSLLSVLYQLDGLKALKQITPIVVKHWSIVAGRIVSVFHDVQTIESDLWVSAHNFLGFLLCEENKLLTLQGHRDKDTYYVLDQLDNCKNTDEKDLFSSSSGGLLCQEIVKAYDMLCRRPLEQHYVVKIAVHNSLKSLLQMSTTAKIAALEAGLVESVCEHLKHIHLKLNMDALELGKGSSGKKKENPIITELMLTYDLLRNFMYGNNEVKLSANECNLAGLVHCMWAWCQVDPVLMDNALSLLTTFTARCTQACSSLAFTTPSLPLDSNFTKVQHSNNSLVHALIKHLQRETSSNQATHLLKSGFSLLANLTLSPECRGILWKSNFLHEFTSFSPKKNKKTKRIKVVESLWLDMLVNLSFSTEGQNMILKIEDSVSLLLEFGTNGAEHNQSCATLILRNLCFHAANKPKLLSNEKLVPFFVRCIETSPGEIKKVASSALLALAYNNQKAKGVLKNGHIMRKLQDSYNHLVNMTEQGKQTPVCLQTCAQDLHNVLMLLKT